MQQGMYGQTFVPDFSDYDAQGRLKLSTLLRCLAESAGMACSALGYNRSWMLEHHHVYLLSQYRVRFSETFDYAPDRALRITTWEEGSKGASVIRNYRLTDAADREVALVCSTWLLVDPDTHKLLRPSDFSGEVPRLQPGYPVPMPGKLRVEQTKEQVFREIRYSDLDMNGHVNNAKYADIITDVIPKRFRTQKLVDFQIRYKKEAKLGDVLSVGITETEDVLTVYGTLPDQSLCFDARLIFIM